ncbi:formyltransferase family protein [Methanospirillum sp.]
MNNVFAILGTAGCKKTLHTIDYLKTRMRDLPIVIFETDFRFIFTASQIIFKRNHLLFTWQNATKWTERLIALIKLFGFSVFLILPPFIIKPLFIIIGMIRSAIFSYQLSNRGISFYPVKNLSTQITKTILINNGITWAFLASSQWIIKPEILTNEYNIINFHPGILPYHRSLDSFFWSIFNHDGIGVSAHIVDSGIDTGPILKRFFFFPNGIDLIKLRKECDRLFPIFVYIMIDQIYNKGIQPIHQENGLGLHHRPMNLNELKMTGKILKNLYHDIYIN